MTTRRPLLDPDDAREPAEVLGDAVEARRRQPADVDLVVHRLRGPARDLSPEARGHAVQPDEARGDEPERRGGDADPRGGVRHRTGRDRPCEGRERRERTGDRGAQPAQDEGHEQGQHHDEREGAEHAEERGHQLAGRLAHDRDQHQVEPRDQQAEERRVGEMETARSGANALERLLPAQRRDRVRAADGHQGIDRTHERHEEADRRERPDGPPRDVEAQHRLAHAERRDADPGREPREPDPEQRAQDRAGPGEQRSLGEEDAPDLRAVRAESVQRPHLEDALRQGHRERVEDDVEAEHQGEQAQHPDARPERPLLRRLAHHHAAVERVGVARGEALLEALQVDRRVLHRPEARLDRNAAVESRGGVEVHDDHAPPRERPTPSRVSTPTTSKARATGASTTPESTGTSTPSSQRFSALRGRRDSMRVSPMPTPCSSASAAPTRTSGAAASGSRSRPSSTPKSPKEAARAVVDREELRADTRGLAPRRRLHDRLVLEEARGRADPLETLEPLGARLDAPCSAQFDVRAIRQRARLAYPSIVA